MALVFRGHFYLEKNRTVSAPTPTVPKPGSLAASAKKSDAMIAFFALDLNRIDRCARDYAWPRPETCPDCGHHRVWLHDFVQMIFNGFDRPLQMRRYRCPQCGCVIRLRPAGFFARHQSDAATIRAALGHRLTKGRWPCGCVANRARHWLAALKRNAAAIFGLPALHDLMAAFDRLLAMGCVPVARAV